MIVQIEGRSGLVRDISSGAILNTNQTDYENYMSKKQLAKHQRELIAAQADEINTIKNDLADIKQMLKALIRD